MAQQTIPGFTGLRYGRVSSMDNRFIGKLTDSNHLQSFHTNAPSDYDKKIISLYTQSNLYSNDFLNMINKSTPYYLDGMTDTWKWDIEKPYQFPVVVDVPQSTLDLTNIGIDGKSFELVISAEVAKNVVITLGDKRYGPQLYAVSDPVPYSKGWLQSWVLASDNPSVTSLDRKFIQQGTNIYPDMDVVLGEFDQDLGGLQKLADKITMFETLGSGYGKQHTITSWADDKYVNAKDSAGRPLDIMVYDTPRRGEVPNFRTDVKWEPFIEYAMRKEMMEMKVNRMIWSKPGYFRSNGARQELKKKSAGVYHRMRTSGNYHPYNRGEFSPALIRSVFGDLFYRRVDVGQRRVKLYTNEAGFDVFQQALKKDAFNSGLVFNVGDNDKFVSGTGQALELNFAFNSFVTRETGKVELVHLKELDQPQTNVEFGQNKKSTPVFMVFDVSPTGDGSLTNNIREVRRKGTASMEWGYVEGTRHHLGSFASQGMSSANMFPGYTLWMKDRSDVFIEDMSRTVLIEELPAF